jgi:hypothetical protein
MNTNLPKLVWTKTTYPYPGPIFYTTDWMVLEQRDIYYRILGKAMVETRVNGKGTCFSSIDLIMFGQLGKWSTHLYRHWEGGKRAPTQKAKNWCTCLLQNPPKLDGSHHIDSSHEVINGVCRQQMELSRTKSLDVGGLV